MRAQYRRGSCRRVVPRGGGAHGAPACRLHRTPEISSRGGRRTAGGGKAPPSTMIGRGGERGSRWFCNHFLEHPQKTLIGLARSGRNMARSTSARAGNGFRARRGAPRDAVPGTSSTTATPLFGARGWFSCFAVLIFLRSPPRAPASSFRVWACARKMGPAWVRRRR